MRDEVLEVLRAAKEGIPAGGPRRLYTLSEVSVKPFGRVRHGFPVVSAINQSGAEDLKVLPLGRFKEVLEAEAPFLGGFDLRGAKMVLAGGAVSSLLTGGQVDSGSDYDLFLVDCEDPLGSIEALARALDSHFGGDLVVYRGQRCVTFLGNKGRTETKIQVVQCVYESLGEVLYSFDLGSSAMAWDGEEVYLSAAGSFALRRRANILFLPARNGSYEYRLTKYFERKFDLVLPNLDEEVLSPSDLGEGAFDLPILDIRMPFLGINPNREPTNCNCRIAAWNIYPSSRAVRESQYEDSIATSDPSVVLRRNLRALREGEPSKLCAVGPYVPGSPIESITPNISAAGVKDQAVLAVRNLSSVNFYRLRDALTDGGCLEVLQSLLLKSQEETLATIDKWASKREAHPEMPFLVHVTKGNATAFDVFPRNVVPEAEWYGEAYRRRPVLETI